MRLATGRARLLLVHVDAAPRTPAWRSRTCSAIACRCCCSPAARRNTLHGELTGSRDTYVHFVQDPFDIASIVRAYVKWEYSLPSGVW